MHMNAQVNSECAALHISCRGYLFDGLSSTSPCWTVELVTRDRPRDRLYKYMVYV